METEEEQEDSQENNDWINSGADYSPKAEFKQAVLAMEAVQACREARAKEMKQGFWNNKLDRQGNSVRTWMEDQRKVFINSVAALGNLLSAECLNDTLYEKSKEKIDQTSKTVFEKYAYTIFEFDPKTGGWRKTQTKFIPQVEEELLVPSPHDPKVLMNIKGGWDFKVNAYYDELVPVYDELFKELRNVIFRLKDFKKKTVIG